MKKLRYDEFNNNEFESHRLALDFIDKDTTVLDIGCATGYMAKELLLKKNCEVWGVDGDDKALERASRYCKKVFRCNLDEIDKLPAPNKYFDYVIMLDVVEHLVHPENILAIIKTHLKKGGKVLVSVPNVAHASIRWMMMRGQFQYTETGIMDRTHVHFYTRDSLKKLLIKEGFKVREIIPTNGMCKVPFLCKITDRLPVAWQYRLTCMRSTLFAHQFIAVVKIN